MPALTFADEVEEVLTNRMRNAYRTGEMINVPDWVSGLASALALAVTMIDEEELPRLSAFAHAELSRFIKEHREERKQLYPDDIKSEDD